MAVTTYLTTAQALDAIPHLRSRIGESTTPLSTSDLTDIIEEVSAEVSGALREAGITPSSIAGDDDAAAQMRGIAKKGVAAAALRTIAAGGVNVDPGVARELRLAFEAGLKQIRQSGTNVGSLETYAESTGRLPTLMLSGGDNETAPITHGFKM